MYCSVATSRAFGNAGCGLCLSRSGFAPSLEEAAEERNDLGLFTVGDIVTTLSE